MKRLLLLLAVLALVCPATAVNSQTLIDVYDGSFDPDSAEVIPGQSVIWRVIEKSPVLVISSDSTSSVSFESYFLGIGDTFAVPVTWDDYTGNRPDPIYYRDLWYPDSLSIITMPDRCYARGDINGDGLPLTTTDAVVFAAYMQDTVNNTLLDRMEADLNGDCTVDMNDLLILENYFVDGFSVFTPYGGYPVHTCCCCKGTRGNVDGSLDELVTIGDLTVLNDHLFGSLKPLDCWEEGNIDGSLPEGPGSVSMGDLTRMIDFLFISFTPLDACPEPGY